MLLLVNINCAMTFLYSCVKCGLGDVKCGLGDVKCGLGDYHLCLFV